MERELAMTTGIIPRLIEKVNRNRVLAGMNTATDETEAGTFVHAEDQNPPGGTSTSAVPVRITGVHPNSPVGDDDVKTYTANCFANGPETYATLDGVSVRALQIAAGETIPTGSVFFATRFSGVTWTNKDGDPVTETVYYVQVPIWL